MKSQDKIVAQAGLAWDHQVSLGQNFFFSFWVYLKVRPEILGQYCQLRLGQLRTIRLAQDQFFFLFGRGGVTKHLLSQDNFGYLRTVSKVFQFSVRVCAKNEDSVQGLGQVSLCQVISPTKESQLVFCYTRPKFLKCQTKKTGPFFRRPPPPKITCPAERQRGRRRKIMVFHEREPIKNVMPNSFLYISYPQAYPQTPD